MQDLVAQFTDSANAAGQLHDQVNGEITNATAQILSNAESAITTAVHIANNIWNQVIDTYCRFAQLAARSSQLNKIFHKSGKEIFLIANHSCAALLLGMPYSDVLAQGLPYSPQTQSSLQS